jgi:Holliday junction resolvase
VQDLRGGEEAGGNMSRGIRRERQVRKLLEANGYWTSRAAGSFGDADVIALKATPDGIDALLVECKSDVAGPFAHFGPAARAELIAAAVKSGATPTLVWWPPRKQPRFIPVSEWPATREEAA